MQEIRVQLVDQDQKAKEVILVAQVPKGVQDHLVLEDLKGHREWKEK